MLISIRLALVLVNYIYRRRFVEMQFLHGSRSSSAALWPSINDVMHLREEGGHTFVTMCDEGERGVLEL